MQALLGPQQTAEQAAPSFQQGRKPVVFALLTLAKQLAERPTAAPTTLDPIRSNPAVSEAGRQGPSQAQGGPAWAPRRSPRRPAADRQTRGTHPRDLPPMPQPSAPCRSSRTRILEDIPADITPVATEHVIRRYWCPGCCTTVEQIVTDALSGSTIGLRVVVISAWLHYLLGTTLAQIIDVFNFHLQSEVSAGGLVQMWHRLREVLFAWYLEIQAQALDSAVLHADETGWRVNGKTHWLWCFTTTDATYYRIDRSRGSSVLKRFYRKEFAGMLVSGFWAAYNAVVCTQKQKCLSQLLRDLKRTQHYHQPGGDWPAFSRLLKRLIRDSIRLSKRRKELPPERFAVRRQRLHERLRELLARPWEQRHARRLMKRLRRHEAELITFVDHDEVPSDNNHAERQIRPR